MRGGLRSPANYAGQESAGGISRAATDCKYRKRIDLMNWKVFLKRTAPRLLAAVLFAALLVGVIAGLLHGRAGIFTDLEGRLREPFQQGAHRVAGWLESLYGSV